MTFIKQSVAAAAIAAGIVVALPPTGARASGGSDTRCSEVATATSDPSTPASVSSQPPRSPAATDITISCRDLIEKPGGLTQTLETIAHLLGVLAWPLVALAFLLAYRPQIGRLIDRIKAIELSKSGVKFVLGVDRAEENAEEAGIEFAPMEDLVAQRRIRSRAEVDARGTVLSAWAGVQQAINNVVRAKGLAPDFARIEQRPYTAMRLIQDAKLLDPKYATLFADLRRLRSLAYAKDFNPPPEYVLRYVAMAQDLATALSHAAGS